MTTKQRRKRKEQQRKQGILIILSALFIALPIALALGSVLKITF